MWRWNLKDRFMTCMLYDMNSRIHHDCVGFGVEGPEADRMANMATCFCSTNTCLVLLCLLQESLVDASRLV